MEAPKLPDKIYFTCLDVGSGWIYSPSLDDNGGEQYIRKEALLKKISELRTIPHDNAIARDNAFIEVIGIIESL